jgi:hypothetical protein
LWLSEQATRDLLMKPQNIVIALVLTADGASLSAVAEWPVISERQVAPAEFDFTAMHRQASDALDNLRRSATSGRDQPCCLLIPSGQVTSSRV